MTTTATELIAQARILRTAIKNLEQLYREVEQKATKQVLQENYNEMQAEIYSEEAKLNAK